MAITTRTPTPTQTPAQPKRRFGRRALLTTAATVTVCGAGAIAAPKLVPVLESKVQDMARDAVLNEIGSLEGVSLDAAIKAAEITRAAVQILVLPLARFMAAVGTGALGLLLSALTLAHNVLSFAHANTTVLDAFRSVVTSWQAGVAGLPVALAAYTTADIDSGERYLRALKRMAERPHVS